MEDITLIIEREPFWRAIPPGSIIGPLYNLIDNPDFELWNFGIADSQPDSWSDVNTLSITGTNNRQETAPHSGQYALRIDVTGSSAVNAAKGVTQVIDDIQDETEYTVIAWVRNDGITSGVGRILITYSSQLELYRDDSVHGWTLYTGKITTGIDDVVAITCEILTTATSPQTLGAMYVDSLMFLEGDFEQLATDNILPYVSGGHIVNHWDIPGESVVEAGDINWIDAWSVPGDVSAPVRLELISKTDTVTLSNPAEVISSLRVGMRRTRNIFNFQNVNDLTGPIDTTASGDSRIESGTLSDTWITISTHIINGADITFDNAGRFRMFARIYDNAANPNLEIRVRYWIGSAVTNIKALDAVMAPISGNWAIVDLTPTTTINWAVKNLGDPPSSLGFDIQMKRASGSDEGYLDYAILMPTDGGILTAEIDPAVLENEGLIIDCTGVLSVVYGARVSTEWKLVTETTGALGASHNWMKDYKGALYIGTALTAVYKYFNGVTTAFGISSADAGFVIYNGKLFSFDSGVPSPSYASDGSTWPGPQEFTFGTTLPKAAIALGNKLYIAGQDTVGGFAVLYEWDGSGAAALAVSDAGVTSYQSIGKYKNKIYLGGDDGTATIYVFDPSNDTITETFDTGQVADTFRFAEFNGKLYVILRAKDKAYSFDGETWDTLTLTTDFTKILYDVGAFGDTIFITGVDQTATPDTLFVMKSTDGETWTLDFHPPLTVATEGRVLDVSEGQIYLGTQQSPAGQVYVKSLLPNEYKVSDYQLSCFFSPSRKKDDERRHRFFFNWDRKNDVNVVDDNILVGLGFVPRYLALRGRD
jgi:hypothetical protein